MKQDRKEMAKAIIDSPSAYKICTVCGAIVDALCDICPDCYAYRFDPDEEHVRNAALDLATKPQTAVSHLDSIPRDED